MISLHLFLKLWVGLKAVELSRGNPNIVFTFTFEYENEIKFGKVGNENENEFAGYPKIRKTNWFDREHVEHDTFPIELRKSKLETPTSRT
jgi:hypothetical protein